MITGKSLLILGTAIALSTLLFGLIFAYFRTRLRQTPGCQNYNQGVERLKRGNCKRAVDNLSKLQLLTPPKSEVHSKIPFKPSSTPPRSTSKASSGSQDKKIRLSQASRELQNQLLRSLHGDRELAIRLLSQVKTKNPGKPVDWYVEKVIYDLERDRGR